MLIASSATSVQSSNYQSSEDIELVKIATYAGGRFGEGAAEIVAYDSNTQRLFVTNGEAERIDVLDISDAKNDNVLSVGTLDVTDVIPNGSPNSVAVCNGIVAVAIQANTINLPGSVGFYDSETLKPLDDFVVGVLPDMVAFTPDCRYVLSANEAEPNDDYDIDPEGTVSIIDLQGGLAYATVSTVDFKRFNGEEDRLNQRGIRVFGPNASASQDFEPEYIAISKDSKTAYVSLQENNALAVIDIKNAKVTGLSTFGTQDHSRIPLDASAKDGQINIRTYPRLRGMYQPDSIATYNYQGRTFIVTANEGDARDYDGFSEEAVVDDLVLDDDAFPNAAELQADELLGKLDITTTLGDIQDDGDYEELFSFGSRSFSIFNSSGLQVFDSGSDFEKITADRLGLHAFNTDKDEFDANDEIRSVNKGPEPEGLALGRIQGKTYAFIGLERVGGIMVYDISNPYRAKFKSYFNDRDFSKNIEEQGDLAPEGLAFIAADNSPTGEPLLAVSYETSGTTVVYQIQFIHNRY